MLAAMQAGTAPDVFQGCCTHFPTWAQKGYTVDLRPYVQADLDQATIADWDPAAATSFERLVAEGDAAMYREKRRRRRCQASG